MQVRVLLRGLNDLNFSNHFLTLVAVARIAKWVRQRSHKAPIRKDSVGSIPTACMCRIRLAAIAPLL